MPVKLTPKLVKIIDEDVYANQDKPLYETLLKYGVTGEEVLAAKRRHDAKRLARQKPLASFYSEYDGKEDPE